jgi:hypothetical protein
VTVLVVVLKTVAVAVATADGRGEKRVKKEGKWWGQSSSLVTRRDSRSESRVEHTSRGLGHVLNAVVSRAESRRSENFENVVEGC